MIRLFVTIMRHTAYHVSTYKECQKRQKFPCGFDYNYIDEKTEILYT